MNQLCLRLLTLLLLLQSTFIHASLERLSELIDDADYLSAYQLAETMVPEWEGVVEFDYPYGVAAVEAGQLDLGILALERVLVFQPGNGPARLELARALFLRGDVDQAQQQFTLILQENPPASVRANIELYLTRIAQRTASTSRFYTDYRVALRSGYDSNLNSAPDALSGPVQLSDDATGQEDGFAQLNLAADFNYRFSDGITGFSQLALEQRSYFEEGAQDFFDGRLTLGARWPLVGGVLQLASGYEHYRLDQQRYRTGYRLAGRWIRALDNDSSLTLDLASHWLDYQYADWRDSRLDTVGFSLYRQFHWRRPTLLFAGGFIGREQPDNPEDVRVAGAVDRQLYGAYLGGRMALKSDRALVFSLVAQHSDYAGDDWIYNAPREDRYYALDIHWERLMGNQWAAQIGVRSSRNDSGIELHDYKRHQLYIAIEFRKGR